MKFHAKLFACLAMLFFAAGCSSILPTPTPTPTATPLPTNTPTVPPPTATRPNPTATKENDLPPAIAFALNKTQGAHSMNFEFESAMTVVQNGETKQVPGLALKGADSTINRQFTLSGMTSDTNEFISYDVIVVGEKVFMRGITGVPGVDAQQWYEIPERAQAGVRQLPSARSLIASFAPEDVAQAQFKSAGNETIDGENCSVWSAQNPTFAQTLIGVTEDSELRQQLGEIEATEFKLWTCADGYIHRLNGFVQGHSTQNPANKVTVTLRFKMSDFDQPLKIQAPTNAKPFPTAAPPTAAKPTVAATSRTTASPTKANNETPAATASPTEANDETPAVTETPDATASPNTTPEVTETPNATITPTP
ncbi:MAG: hypothetical protein EYC68_11720 [Chloroflexota bacterium]|nr:MAG: hypothetical protein EYC68_11720 [Chloroflexota bacterium]